MNHSTTPYAILKIVLVSLLTLVTLVGCSDAGVFGLWESQADSPSSSSGGFPNDPWYDANKTSRRRVIIDNRAQSETLAGFQLMVRLDSSRMDYTEAESDGSDLSFVDAGNESELYYEIEAWNPGDESIVWVRVPEVTASGYDYIWMYYGGGAQPGYAYRSAADVWSDYEVVYHLGEITGADEVTDSAGTSDGTVNGAAGGPIEPGIIGSGFRTKHSSDASAKQYVDTNYNAESQNGTVPAAWTIEAWAKGDSAPAMTSQITGPIKGRYYYNIEWDHNSNPAGLVFKDDSWHTDVSLGGTSLQGNRWYYLGGVYSKADGSVVGYRDGVQTDSDTTVSGSLASTTDTVFLGTESNTNNVMDGVIDEIRIAHVARSADWMAAQYRSMTDSMLTFGAPEARE